ncbi:MAG: glycogen debranching protein GlgX [Desulfobacterales bacterium]|jgi:glycogen operon protein
MNGAVLSPGVRVGQSYPLGATPDTAGVNFSVFSKNATAVDLLFFDAVDDPRPARVISLDRRANRTFHFWHVYVAGIRPGQLYAYRAHGPFDPAKGLRFNPDKVLLDPYGKSVAIPAGYNREAATVPGDNAPCAMKSVVAATDRYDWEGDAPLKRPFVQTVIYEMHVKGFTAHPSSGVAPDIRGTYAGLIEKIPYLQHLGITAVELLPVFQFDATEAPPGLTNYWGYNPVSFFTPHLGYSSRKDPLGPLDEFRDMVKALHRAGIEIILDVVYNHTAESHDRGPTLCFRGLENDDYYILEPDKALYADYSGTGNTLNTNHSTVRRLIMDSLRYWVEVMHVDGFRFDLASILSRDEDGRPLTNPPILLDIESDPVLAGTKLIAEAWDAAGLYQVGSFIGDQWKEWNGRFRDDVRSFFRGDEGSVKKLPDRFFASPDIYGHEEREPEQSINFVTCHDGFTLNDLVSYNQKHNEANGEDNRDGHDDNRSWNCGVEGPSDDPAIEGLRSRQVKNFFMINLLALGVPMILMGDEMRRTQRGNNNAYCQDNDINWFDWRLLERYGDIHRFVRKMIRLRLSLDVFQEERGRSLNQFLQSSRIDWHGTRLHRPDWSDHSHSLAFTVQGGERLFHIIFNAYREALEFELPPLPADPPARWRRIIDTDRGSPDDIVDMSGAPAVDGESYCVQAHSVVLLARG